jgi:outer membrane immunogenic protein
MAGIRFWILSLIAICLLAGSAAGAADYSPSLPTPQLCCGGWSPQWGGFYVGGHYGYANLSSNFADSVPGIEMPDNVSSSGNMFGVFVGYNTQIWDPQLVLGMELAYNRPSSLETFATGSDGLTTSSYELKDYFTFRGRAGYAFGAFLPYGVLGVALGRVDHSTTDAAGSVSEFSNTVPIGFVWGLGLDVEVFPQVFLRGEWEQTIFSPEGGIRSTVGTARVGIGVRF